MPAQTETSAVATVTSLIEEQLQNCEVLLKAQNRVVTKWQVIKCGYLIAGRPII